MVILLLIAIKKKTTEFLSFRHFISFLDATLTLEKPESVTSWSIPAILPQGSSLKHR